MCWFKSISKQLEIFVALQLKLVRYVGNSKPDVIIKRIVQLFILNVISYHMTVEEKVKPTRIA